MKNSSKQSVKMDMLHGSLFDKMLMFAMPLAACSILQQLFNSVGTAVVGRFASSEALAAVGSNSTMVWSSEQEICQFCDRFDGYIVFWDFSWF